jgi:hypothetical protein
MSDSHLTWRWKLHHRLQVREISVLILILGDLPISALAVFWNQALEVGEKKVGMGKMESPKTNTALVIWRYENLPLSLVMRGPAQLYRHF